MLENSRYNRALHAKSLYTDSDSRGTFFDQEYITQLALNQLHITNATKPAEVGKVGTLLMIPENITNLRLPYAVEVLGMPGAGKSTMINRYLEELWGRNERNCVSHISEGASKIKDGNKDLRDTDPFSYSILASSATFLGYINAVKDLKHGMRMMISDRGQIDRRAFRRALFTRGDVNPQIMQDEDQFSNDLENTPVQVCGVIMMMISPETTMSRISKVGPVVNRVFLKNLYEQYWRLHGELIKGRIPYRIYSCIDAEQSTEEVYERFRYAMDTALNIHEIYLDSLRKAFPNEYRTAKKSFDNKKALPGRSRAERILSDELKKRVLIVGGDDMESKEDILEKPYIEGVEF